LLIPKFTNTLLKSKHVVFNCMNLQCIVVCVFIN